MCARESRVLSVCVCVCALDATRRSGDLVARRGQCVVRTTRGSSTSYAPPPRGRPARHDAHAREHALLRVGGGAATFMHLYAMAKYYCVHAVHATRTMHGHT